ncbi:hypothetical protein [Deinococcus wulumuqiensis]|uniref:Uncharacterized protein n=1 Tax=Deinococcus wulumuqiensis TaxID=980427 RepID=A0AAV4K5M1_9DEIO|nr:hypothetical protein [Deinococcus wulumuqiensis]QII20071.1 hypothetical protein G6R31_04295 [Deinococcus wulumuqiensis R12]GGI87381.1 hypothetical protein GCM10010914_22330 [Deinococcus wulumuqiensis]GGP30006.1 hypothetical protein GCM10008021_16570 [Deinococcus wulumuqiensis]
MSWFSLFVWTVYAYSLGASAWLAYQHAPLVFPKWGHIIRWLPGLFVITYYTLNWFFPHPAIKAVQDGTTVALGSDLRFQSSVTALSLSLYILARRAGRTE